jgi:CelD/BcsL family acetyltransferase involved in cellulose biosynthesis
MYKVRVATLDEFKDCQSAWNRLVLQMAAPTVFCTWEWIYSWWEHFGANARRKLFILLIFKEDELVGILPLFRYRAVLKNKWMSGRILSYCGANDLYVDQLDIICAPEHGQISMASVCEYLRTEYRDWDLLELPLITAESTLARSITKSPFDLCNCGAELSPASVAPFITLSGRTFEEYFLGQFNRKRRHNLRNNWRRLEDISVKYELPERHAEFERLNRLFSLHKLRKKKMRMSSTFGGQRIEEFHKALLPRIRDQGWLWLRFLQIDTDIIAGAYGFTIAGRVLFYQSGLDPAWDKLGPGTMLIYRSLQEAFMNGNSEYNFLRGNESYKYFWTDTERALYSGFLNNDTMVGKLSRAMFHVKNMFKRNIAAKMSANSGTEHVETET